MSQLPQCWRARPVLELSVAHVGPVTPTPPSMSHRCANCVMTMAAVRRLPPSARRNCRARECERRKGVPCRAVKQGSMPSSAQEAANHGAYGRSHPALMMYWHTGPSLRLRRGGTAVRGCSCVRRHERLVGGRCKRCLFAAPPAAVAPGGAAAAPDTDGEEFDRYLNGVAVTPRACDAQAAWQAWCPESAAGPPTSRRRQLCPDVPPRTPPR